MSKLLYQRPWMSMYENEQGVTYVQMDDGVMVVPITTRREILFIHEYSVAYDENILFLPSGAVEAGEPLEATANRELQEEIGYKAARIDLVGELHPHIKYMKCRCTIFLARTLQRSKQQGDEQWAITVERVPLKQIDSLIMSGRIKDSTVIATLTLVQRFLSRRKR